jgi:anti-sigma factor RsiW
MDCARAEELLSDHLDGTLGEPLASELRTHLRMCPDCRELYAALREVVAALHALPILPAPRGLAQRVATAAWEPPSPQTTSPVPAGPMARALDMRTRMPSWMQVAAALVAIGTSLVLVSGGSNPRRAGSRLLERGYQAAAYLAERRDRLVEDVRLLRVVVETAFEGRVDRVTDRVDDYRRLLARRKAMQRTNPPSSDGRQQFENSTGLHRVLPDETGRTRRAPAVASGGECSEPRGSASLLEGASV